MPAPESPGARLVQTQHGSAPAQHALGLRLACRPAVIGDGLQWLAQSLQRTRGAVLALAGQHPHAQPPGLADQLQKQTRLADAALARDEQDTAGARLQLRERVAQGLQGRLAPGEPGSIEIGGALRRRLAGLDLGAQCRQSRRDHVGMTGPLARRLRQESQHELVELARHIRRPSRGRLRGAAQVTVQDFLRRGARERRLPRQELEQDAAQGVEVGPRVQDVAAQLLGSHVRQGSGGAGLDGQSLAAEAAGRLAERPKSTSTAWPSAAAGRWVWQEGGRVPGSWGPRTARGRREAGVGRLKAAIGGRGFGESQGAARNCSARDGLRVGGRSGPGGALRLRAAARIKDVLWFQVPVHQPFAVQIGQSPTQLVAHAST